MPRYSIAVTTVDRPQVLEASLAALLALPRDDIEIVVSDNYSDARTQEVLTHFDDPRLRTLRTERRLPMPEHWEWVWQQMTGDYVIFVGDDSALTPGALIAADKAIEDYGAEIVSWRCAHYYHPDWKVHYKHLPTRGNVLAIDMGFTHELYRVDTDAVIEHFCETLRLSGCFPSVINFLVKRSLGDEIRANTGAFHWAPCPDISASFFALGSIRPGRFVFWDGLGGIGGRSNDSNVASLLSRGKRSKRLREWLDEFESPEARFPLHDYRIESISNLLAAPITQAAKLLPDRFNGFRISVKTLAVKSIDDAYLERTVPWADDPTFLAQLEGLIAELPPREQDDARGHLAQARTAMAEQDSRGEAEPNPTPPAEARGLLRFLSEESFSEWRRNWELYRSIGRNPIDRFWEFGDTIYCDMRAFGGESLADVAGALPQVLAAFETGEPGFARHYRGCGMLTEKLEQVAPA